MTEIETKMHRHEMTTRYTCVACGHRYTQAAVAVGLFSGEEELGDLCPACLAAGPIGAAERARALALRLHERAAEVAALASAIERVKAWSSVEELRAEEENAHSEFLTALTAIELHHAESHPREHDSEYDERYLWSIRV